VSVVEKKARRKKTAILRPRSKLGESLTRQAWQVKEEKRYSPSFH
jgi:hypothetical protein